MLSDTLEVPIISVLPLVALLFPVSALVGGSCSVVASVLLCEHLAQTCLPLHVDTVVNLPGVL